MMAKGNVIRRPRAFLAKLARRFGVDFRGLTPRRIAKHSLRLQAPAGDVSAAWFGRMAWQDRRLLPALLPGHEFLLLGNAVMKITGIFMPHFMRYSWSCGPVIPRICTSAIKHRVLSTSGERKNASQDLKVSTSNPNVSTSPPVATRTLSSSSIIDINGTKARIILPLLEQPPCCLLWQRFAPQLNRDFAAATSQIKGPIIVSISQLAFSMI